MPTVDEIVAELKKLGNATHKANFTNHGAKEPFFGVSIADLKKIQNASRRTRNWCCGCTSDMAFLMCSTWPP